MKQLRPIKVRAVSSTIGFGNPEGQAVIEFPENLYKSNLKLGKYLR